MTPASAAGMRIPRQCRFPVVFTSILLTVYSLYQLAFSLTPILLINFLANLFLCFIVHILARPDFSKLRPDFALEQTVCILVIVGGSFHGILLATIMVRNPWWLPGGILYTALRMKETLLHLLLLIFFTFQGRRELKKFTKLIRQLNPHHELSDDDALVLFGLENLRCAIPKPELPILEKQPIKRAAVVDQLNALHLDNFYLHRRWAQELRENPTSMAADIVAGELERRLEYCRLTSTVNPCVYPRNHWASEIFQLESLHADDFEHFSEWLQTLRLYAFHDSGDESTEAGDSDMAAAAINAIIDEMEKRAKGFDILPNDREALALLASKGCSLRVPMEKETVIGWKWLREVGGVNKPTPVPTESA